MHSFSSWPFVIPHGISETPLQSEISGSKVALMWRQKPWFFFWTKVSLLKTVLEFQKINSVLISHLFLPISFTWCHSLKYALKQTVETIIETTATVLPLRNYFRLEITLLVCINLLQLFSLKPTYLNIIICWKPHSTINISHQELLFFFFFFNE